MNLYNEFNNLFTQYILQVKIANKNKKTGDTIKAINQGKTLSLMYKIIEKLNQINQDLNQINQEKIKTLNSFNFKKLAGSQTNPKETSIIMKIITISMATDHTENQNLIKTETINTICPISIYLNNNKNEKCINIKTMYEKIANFITMMILLNNFNNKNDNNNYFIGFEKNNSNLKKLNSYFDSNILFKLIKQILSTLKRYYQ